MFTGQLKPAQLDPANKILMFLGTLLPAQIDCANKMCAWRTCLVGMPQGTGKTVIAIAAAEKLVELSYIEKIIVLAPTSIAWQWPEKIKEFTDHEDVRLVESKNKSSREYDTYSSLYTVIPFSTFRKDFDEIKSLPRSLIIADEAEEFSNFRAKTFKLIKKFRAKYQWALTGTAISSKLEELYAIMQWVDPYFLPKWAEFEKLHIVRNRNSKQIIKYKNIEALHGYLASKRMVRKSLTEMKDQLPEIIFDRKYVDKDENITTAEKALLKALENPSSSSRFDPEVSSALHAARQSVCGESKRSLVLELISRILAEDDNNRVVVFCFYKEPLYSLAERLNGIGTLFTGDQSADEKRLATQQFESGKSKVILCSNAGARGLDLPFANYVIHMDVPYSFGIMDQRSRRIQRTSSKFSTVIVYFILAKESIDLYYYTVTINKGKLNKAALEGGLDSIVMKESSLKDYLLNVYDN